MEVRRVLEAEVAELAALRRTDEDLAAIRAAMQHIADAVRTGRDGVEEDVLFHRAIAQAAGNPFMMTALCASIGNVFGGLLWHAGFLHTFCPLVNFFEGLTT